MCHQCVLDCLNNKSLCLTEGHNYQGPPGEDTIKLSGRLHQRHSGSCGHNEVLFGISLSCNSIKLLLLNGLSECTLYVSGELNL